MEFSVLERQRAILQRIYHGQEHHHLNIEQQQQQQLLWQQHSQLKADHHQTTIHPNPQMINRSSSADNSSLTSLPILKTDWQCNSTTTTFVAKSNKRKPEFGVDEESEDERRIEVEEGAAEEKSDITTKAERETSANTSSKESLKASEVQKPDYIHVRARRGQATDSHSLAERARREKITKKMKCLQDLVPGCNKVTGKAGMLDEIINYVQSLQKQVEFLSMKLSTINPRLDICIDNFFAKEIPAYIASLQPATAAAAQLEATNPAYFQYNPMQLGISNYTADVAADQSHLTSSQKGGTSSLPIPEMFLDPSCISQLQQLSGSETDWQNLFTAGFQ